MKTKILFLILCTGMLLLGWPSKALFAKSSAGYLMRGTAKTFLSAFEIPRTMLQHSQQVMFPFGLVTGTVVGAARTVTGTLSGVFDLARGAAPYAKYAIFLV